MCFPHSSVGKESPCNARDPGSIPGLGRSPGEGIGYPLQYSWAFLVAQLVKNQPAMQETWFDPWLGKIPWRSLEGYPLQYSSLENSIDCIVHGVTKSLSLTPSLPHSPFKSRLKVLRLDYTFNSLQLYVNI